MLQDEISKLGGFFKGIEYYNDALIVKVGFPNRWQVYPSDNGLIKPAGGEHEEGADTIQYYYYGDSNNVTLDDIFNLINDTITANRDAEMKVRLLTDKYDELKDLFRQYSYEELLSLKFVFDKNKEIKEEKPKRKYTKKKKKEEKIEQDAKEEEITVSNEIENEE